MKKNKKRRKNPSFQGTSKNPSFSLLEMGGVVLSSVIAEQLQDLTIQEKTFLLALLPQLKAVIRAIPKEKLAEMTPDTHITIH